MYVCSRSVRMKQEGHFYLPDLGEEYTGDYGDKVDDDSDVDDVESDPVVDAEDDDDHVVQAWML